VTCPPFTEPLGSTLSYGEVVSNDSELFDVTETEMDKCRILLLVSALHSDFYTRDICRSCNLHIYLSTATVFTLIIENVPTK
jgi:hypothetical protein